MMVQVLISIVAISFVVILFIFACSDDKRTKWLNDLKIGDKILIRIHSVYCNCSRQATVTNLSDDKMINAKMDDVTLNKCKVCSLDRAVSPSGVNTCWYHVTSFTKDDVCDINE